MATLLKTLRTKPKKAAAPVVGEAVFRSLSLVLDADFVGVALGPDPWYLATADTIRVHGSLTGPGLILITIEKLDFDYLAETGQLKWGPHTTVRTRTPLLGGEYSVQQSFPAYWSGPGWPAGYKDGAYRLKASTYPFGLVVSPRVCLNVFTAPAERIA